MAVSAALVVVAALWAIGRVDWPDPIFSWSFWTTKPEDVRTLLFVSLGVLAAAIGLALAAVRTHAANLQARAANLQARIAEQGHITDRFTKAIEQLGHDKLEVRLGAIYALERIARDSRRDHGPIMETLTAYVRENAPWPPKDETEALEGLLAAHVPVGGEPSGEPAAEEDPSRAKPRTDIQAILTVLVRRDRQQDVEGEQLNLRSTDLRGANLEHVHLEGADLTRTHLEGASLEGARLEGADLTGAHLEGARLRGARLERAYLVVAHLEGASLWGAHLERARLTGAHLEGASLFNAHLEGARLGNAHLEGARLYNAHLEGADLERARLEGADLTDACLKGASLWGAHLEGADLTRTHLEGADLRSAQGLTREKLVGTYQDEGTKLPESLTTSPADA